MCRLSASKLWDDIKKRKARGKVAYKRIVGERCKAAVDYLVKGTSNKGGPLTRASIIAVVYGNVYETKALQQLSNKLNIELKQCGIFVNGISAASPDGIAIDRDNKLFLVEVKCPAIVTWGKNDKEGVGDFEMVKYLSGSPRRLVSDHAYYWQIQQQLHCCPQAEYVCFGVYIPFQEMHVEYIYRNEEIQRSIQDQEVEYHRDMEDEMKRLDSTLHRMPTPKELLSVARDAVRTLPDNPYSAENISKRPTANGHQDDTENRLRLFDIYPYDVKSKCS